MGWGLLPLLPSLLSGQLAGHPYTDLYPSVWGLGWFASHITEVLPTFAPELAAPQGMPFYYSSPLHGWVAAPLIPLLGLPLSWWLTLAAARVATVLCAYGAGRALGLEGPGALVLAAVYGCAPFFHGYAVEGIVEGTDGWVLPLWIWLARRQRWLPATLAAALVVASSWYMAMVGMLVALAWTRWSWRAALSFAGGLVLASPLLWAFFAAFSGGEPLDPAVRRAMGTPLWPFPAPGALPGLQPFAKTSWIGWVAAPLALASARRHPWWAAGALGAWLLSLGWGPLYELPVWSGVRFPYRLHAATLVAVGFLAGSTADELVIRWQRPLLLGSGLALTMVLEGLLLSPVEPVVPGAPAEVPALYRQHLPGMVVLAAPGPLAMPPGQANPSRPRSRYLLYQAGQVQARTAWALDFNSVGAGGTEAEVLEAVRSWDPHGPGGRLPVPLSQLAAAGVDVVVLHHAELGARSTRELRAHLLSQGASLLAEDEELTLLGGW